MPCKMSKNPIGSQPSWLEIPRSMFKWEIYKCDLLAKNTKRENSYTYSYDVSVLPLISEYMNHFS